MDVTLAGIATSVMLRSLQKALRLISVTPFSITSEVMESALSYHGTAVSVPKVHIGPVPLMTSSPVS